jgi:ABC-type transport system involved in multi-copper enzyme maturation permease subunit
MPSSLCSYFWTALISIIISIPTIPFLLLSYKTNPKNLKSDQMPVALSLILVLFMLLGGATLWMNLTGITIWSPLAIFVAYLLGLAAVAVIVIGAIGLFSAGSYGYDQYDVWRKDKREKDALAGIVKVKKPNWFIEFFKAKKAKMCPMINYTEE